MHGPHKEPACNQEFGKYWLPGRSGRSSLGPLHQGPALPLCSLNQAPAPPVPPHAQRWRGSVSVILASHPRPNLPPAPLVSPGLSSDSLSYLVFHFSQITPGPTQDDIPSLLPERETSSAMSGPSHCACRYRAAHPESPAHTQARPSLSTFFPHLGGHRDSTLLRCFCVCVLMVRAFLSGHQHFMYKPVSVPTTSL